MITRFLLLFLGAFLFSSSLKAQTDSTRPNPALIVPAFTPGVERLKSAASKKSLVENSLVREVPFSNIGPTVFGGRVADLDVWETDPTHFYVAYASGGLWKTENNGQSFEPIFDQEMMLNLGDIAVDWTHDIIWAGTGEVNSSRSSYAGIGIYKSSNGGKTWEYKGLEESHHIGRIVLHPTDTNTLWVAALGHLYSPNYERGVYKTTDGGRTWKKTLFVNVNAGAVDLILDPVNPEILYASTWERTRRSWNFEEAGPGSGVWKSTDGGNSWIPVTLPGSGFPSGSLVGRIGLATAQKDGKSLVLAVVDNQGARPDDKKETKLTRARLRNMTAETFLKLDEKRVKEFLKENDFPEKYDAKTILEKIEKKEITPQTLVEYLEDANSLLFDTEVIGAEVYKSMDGGISWEKTHTDYIDDLFYTYGYYFAQIRVDPNNSDRVTIMGVPILQSEDGGKTWKNILGDNVHVDHHALWVNPEREGHLILGNDGGINISYDHGKHWFKVQNPPVGQFYYINVDMEKPYNVYGGTQDNGVWKGPNNYKAGDGWQNTGAYPYDFLLGGDGMQVMIDSRNNQTVYTGFQFGNYFRLEGQSGKRVSITPRHELNQRPFRWNWQTPIHLSQHNQDILYMGSHCLHRSLDQGKSWELISGDLTRGGQKGDVPFGTLSTIHESAMKFGLLYTGSDDGLVHISRDGGFSWKNISTGLPENFWVSRIQASRFEEGRVYVVLNGYRWDNFQPLLYVSDNYGENWTKLGQDLPLEALNVVKEDPENPNIIYVGSDQGVSVSIDRGKTFMAFEKGLPPVAVHDLVIHPRENDLLVGTHGRSIYKASVKELQLLSDTLLEKPIFAFDIPSIRHSTNWGRKTASWRQPREPQVSFSFYLQEAGEVQCSLETEMVSIKKWTIEGKKGLNYATFTPSVDPAKKDAYEKWAKEKDKNASIQAADNGIIYTLPGTYKLVLAVKGSQAITSWEVKAD